MDKALKDIARNAKSNEHKYPTLRTLLAEIAELAYALDGEHEHTPEYELVEIGGCVVNWLRRIHREKGQALTALGRLCEFTDEKGKRDDPSYG